MLDDAIELLPPAKLAKLVRPYLDVKQLRPDAPDKKSLLTEVGAFDRASRAGTYYESFNVTRRTSWTSPPEREPSSPTATGCSIVALAQGPFARRTHTFEPSTTTSRRAAVTSEPPWPLRTASWSPPTTSYATAPCTAISVRATSIHCNAIGSLDTTSGAHAISATNSNRSPTRLPRSATVRRSIRRNLSRSAVASSTSSRTGTTPLAWPGSTRSCPPRLDAVGQRTRLPALQLLAGHARPCRWRSARAGDLPATEEPARAGGRCSRGAG
jgi:hypothetical protein